MSDPKTQEPSMEEILASIRRIISEEGGTPAEGAPGAPSEPPAANKDAAKDEVLELTEVVEEDGSVSKLAEPEPTMPPPAAERPPAERAAPPAGEAGLISETAASASASTLAELATLVARREAPKGDLPLGRTDLTLEGLVAELIRPYLREWLDLHLPGLIERLVRQEIERLVRRAEGR